MPSKYDIYVAEVKFEDIEGTKIRPVLVIDDSETYLCSKITSLDVRLTDTGDVRLLDWETEGLEKPSVVRLSHLIYKHDYDLYKYIGHLTEKDISRVEMNLKYVYEPVITEARKNNKQKKTDYTLLQSKFKTVNDIMKWTKKRLKGLGSFVTYSWDVGNMDYNASLFNRMMGSGDTLSSGGTSADGAVASSSSMISGGSGMGESFTLDLESNNNEILTEARELSARPDVQTFLEDNIELLEKDPQEFIAKAFRDYNSYNRDLDRIDLSNLLRILHSVGIDLDPQTYPENHIYIDYDTIGSDEDYLNILEDLVSVVPNRYIDKKYWEDKTVEQVLDAIQDDLKYQIENTISPVDTDSGVYGLRVECFVLGNGFDQSDRRIGVQIIIETYDDIGVIELEGFGNIFLDSLGYMISKKHANDWLDEYKRDIEIALKHIKQ